MQGQVVSKTSGSPNGFKLSSLQKIDTICSGLSEINISKNLEQIDLIVFNRCVRLTFEVDEENPNYATSDDRKILFTKDKKTLICYPSASGDVVIPNDVEIIGDDAFFCLPDVHTLPAVSVLILRDAAKTIRPDRFL